MSQLSNETTQTREAEFLHPEQRILIMLSMFLQRQAGTWLWFPSPRQMHFSGFLLIFYILPYVVLWATQWPEIFRHGLVGVVFAGLIGYALRYRRSWRELGFRLDTLKPALLQLALPTLLLVLAMVAVRQFDLVRVSPRPVYQPWMLVYYFLVSAPLQEYAFRSVLFSEMNRHKVRLPWVQVLISAVTFSLLHLHHCDPLTMFVTFAAGTWWGWVYYRTPNAYAMALTHGVLGIATIVTRII